MHKCMYTNSVFTLTVSYCTLVIAKIPVCAWFVESSVGCKDWQEQEEMICDISPSHIWSVSH